MSYNGWKNHSTWNVALWIENDEPLYRAACDFMRHYHGNAPYACFIRKNGLTNDKTPDGIKYISHMLDYHQLNEMMRDLI